MILAWHSRLAVESWRISRRPGDLPIYVARRVVTDFASAIARLERGAADPALLNMLAAAKLVAAGALIRQESRGGHWRSDFPLTAATGARSFFTLADANRIAAGAPAPMRRVQA